MKFLESMPREVPEVARSMPHWRQRAAAGWLGWETIFRFHLVPLKKAHWLCWKCGDSVKHRGLRQVVCFCYVAFGEPSRGSIVTYCVFWREQFRISSSPAIDWWAASSVPSHVQKNTPEQQTVCYTPKEGHIHCNNLGTLHIAVPYYAVPLAWLLPDLPLNCGAYEYSKPSDRLEFRLVNWNISHLIW